MILHEKWKEEGEKKEEKWGERDGDKIVGDEDK